jgi:tRNA-specific 2-thiouridylase
VRKLKVIAAMSGGVDSSVMAAMLVEQGHEVVGVTLNVEPRLAALEQVERVDACCSLGAVEDARRVADRIGIPHYTLNFRDVFRDRVIENFVEEYRRGRTPNPCVRCNEHIKFEGVLNRLHGLDADAVATGHFVRREWHAAADHWALRKGVDARKDQSYVLYPLTQELLSRSIFPLGEMTKEQVRARARELGLITAEKPESQEICFVADNDYGGFIARYAADAVRPGPIVDRAGRELGEHRGIVYYTVGQRRGLGIASGEPLYVVEIDAERNAVVVGAEDELLRHGLETEPVNWVAINTPAAPIRAAVKIRYRAPEVPVTIEPLASGGVRAWFETPLKAVTPGQAAVFYDGDMVLGGATIARALRADDRLSPQPLELGVGEGLVPSRLVRT